MKPIKIHIEKTCRIALDLETKINASDLDQLRNDLDRRLRFADTVVRMSISTVKTTGDRYAWFCG